MLAAAASLGVVRRDLGHPRVKLVDQTPLIHVSLDAASPAEARQRLRAVLAAFNAQLDSLRADETAKRDEGYRRTVAGFRSGVEEARARLVGF